MKPNMKVKLIQVLPDSGLITVKQLGKYIGASSAEQTIMMLPDGVKVSVVGSLSSSLINIKELITVQNTTTVASLIETIKAPAVIVPDEPTVEQSDEPANASATGTEQTTEVKPDEAKPEETT